MKIVLILLAISTSVLFSANFPQFMGPDRNNIVNDTKLLKVWPADGLKELWRIKVGSGFAAPVVYGDKIYFLDYDLAKEEDVVRCLDSKTAKEEWRSAYSSKMEKTKYDYARTMPSVTDKYVVTFGTQCVITCLDRVTGLVVWQKDLVKEYETTVPKWHAGQNPNIDGVKMYLSCSKIGAFGISADDGRLLFTHKDWKVKMANVPSPLVIEKNRVLFTGGYNAGSVILSLRKEGKEIFLKEEVRLKGKVFGSHVHTPILYNNHIFGISMGKLKCLNLDGKVLWDSGEEEFGLGSYLIADNKLYVLNETGELFMIEASSIGYKKLYKTKIFEGDQIWAPLVMSNGILYIRNMGELAAIDLK